MPDSPIRIGGKGAAPRDLGGSGGLGEPVSLALPACRHDRFGGPDGTGPVSVYRRAG